jgi:hypothetical protein
LATDDFALSNNVGPDNVISESWGSADGVEWVHVFLPDWSAEATYGYGVISGSIVLQHMYSSTVGPDGTVTYTEYHLEGSLSYNGVLQYDSSGNCVLATDVYSGTGTFTAAHGETMTIENQRAAFIYADEAKTELIRVDITAIDSQGPMAGPPPPLNADLMASQQVAEAKAADDLPDGVTATGEMWKKPQPLPVKEPETK